MEIICREDEKLTVTGGIGDRDFGHWMKTLSIGETFEAPEAVIARGDSLYDVCDKLVKALGRRGGAIGFAVYLDSIND